MKKLILAIILVLGIATNGWAFSFDLTTGNATLTGVNAGPYATVEITWIDSHTADFDVKALTGFGLVDGKMFDINASASATVSSIVETALTGFSTETPTVLYNQTPPVTGDFGHFNIWISNQTASNLIQELTFRLTTTGSWADAEAVLAANDKGELAAAHIGINAATTGNRITGFASGDGSGGGGGGTPVPEPGTVLFLGTGLIGLAFFGRRNKRN